MIVRQATPNDQDDIWRILAPIIRAGETYALPRAWSREEALAYWHDPRRNVYVAADPRIVGSYFLMPNQLGGGAHVANCGYAVSADARGVGRAMCEHSLAEARRLGFTAIQFNFVVRTNVRAIALWTRLGFNTIATLPDAFAHPSAGLVDALIMHRQL